MTAPSSSLRIGFIGLGAMGAPMALNLVRAGYTVQGFDLNPVRVETLRQGGGRRAESVATLVRESEVVCTSLPSHDAFVTVAETEFVPHATQGQVFIDFGTTIPHVTRRIWGELARRGAALLDAPVSGGPDGAAARRLRVFVGGDQRVFEQQRALLAAVAGAEKTTYCGPSGSGQVLKGVNQIKSALGTAALVEALAFAVRAGVSAEVVAQAFGTGSASEVSSIVKYARAVSAAPSPHFIVKYRELPYFLEEAAAAGFELPLTQALLAYLAARPHDSNEDNRPAPSLWRELSTATRHETA
jgi:2-hydroxy-3-oxopropionate reductase